MIRFKRTNPPPTATITVIEMVVLSVDSSGSGGASVGCGFGGKGALLETSVGRLGFLPLVEGGKGTGVGIVVLVVDDDEVINIVVEGAGGD